VLLVFQQQLPCNLFLLLLLKNKKDCDRIFRFTYVYSSILLNGMCQEIFNKAVLFIS
jgi:hypothetical protein